MRRLQKMICVICLSLGLASAHGLIGQTQVMKIYKGGSVRNVRVIAPTSLKDAFPSREVVSYSVNPPSTPDAMLASIIRKVELMRISKRTKYEGPVITKEGGKLGEGEAHPRLFPAIVYKNDLYVFNIDGETDNVAVFNQLIKKLKMPVSNNQAAEQVAKFYLFCNTFTNPLISRVDDIPEKYRLGRTERVEKIRQLVHAPRVSQGRDHYEVRLFTWQNLPRGEVIEWIMEISPSGQLSLEQQVIALI